MLRWRLLDELGSSLKPTEGGGESERVVSEVPYFTTTGEEVMKTQKTLWFVLSVSLFLAFLYTSCQVSTDSTVGSSQDTQIANTAVTVDSTYIAGGLMYATGRVTNNGTSTISSPWYVECQFYTDSTYSYKLGGNYKEMTFPLDPGQGTFWTVSFSSSNVNVQQYPRFKVRDQRAIYKK